MLFTFPSRYSFTIGLSGVFSLTGWSRLIHAEFLVLRATQDDTRKIGRFRLRGFHPLCPSFPEAFDSPSYFSLLCSYYPANAVTIAVWAVPRSLAATWGIMYLFSFPAGTKMFQFPALTSSLRGCRHYWRRVVPFGYPRVKGYLHLSAACRSLSRPSSSPRA